MKNKIITTILAISSACLFAQDQAPEPRPEAVAKQAAKAEKQAAEADANLAKATARAGKRAAELAQVDVDTDAFMFNARGGSARRARTLLVATAQTNSESIANLDEDMAIFAHILDKNMASRSNPDQAEAMGIFVAGQPGAKSPQNLYIEGHGAVFMRSVKIALVPGKRKTEETEAPKKDSPWDDAKRDLYGPKEGFFKYGAPRREEIVYDAEKLERLKSQIVGALANAGHIRALGANESVTVVVQGFLGGPASETFGSRIESEDGKTIAAFGGGGSESRRQATMTVKVKKTDADAASSGTIDHAELMKRAAIAIY
jgi:hypothetical protein